MQNTLYRFIQYAKYGSFVGKFARLPLRLIPSDQVVPILSGRLRGKWWVVGSSNHSCWLGTYEYAKQRMLAQLVQPGMTIYDIGANVGFYTLFASVLTRHEGCVVAFEPLPANLAFLHRHIALNRLHNVRVIEAGITDTVGQAKFAHGHSLSMGKLDTGGELEVCVTTIDTLVFQQGLPVPNIIKIDIEGGEARALLGMRAVLSQSAPVILLATHGEYVREECRNILAALGYSMHPLQAYEQGDEFLVQRDP